MVKRNPPPKKVVRRLRTEQIHVYVSPKVIKCLEELTERWADNKTRCVEKAIIDAWEKEMAHAKV